MLAPGLKRLLKRACAIGRRRVALKDATLRTYEADLERRLDNLLIPDATHPAGIKLKRMIRKVRQHLFVFVQNRELEPTNNGSERALRPCAVYRKITNGFRQEWGVHLYADIRSVIETARRHAVRAIDAIRDASTHRRFQPPTEPRHKQGLSNYLIGVEKSKLFIVLMCFLYEDILRLP